MIRHRRNFLPLLSAALALVATTTLPSAHAGTVCDFYRRNAPGLYKTVCQNGSAASKPAGASSSFSSSFNLNSASLPTEPSSYGLETLVSRTRSEGDLSPTFALVKGFQKFGAGLSTGSTNTFYGDDVLQRAGGPSELRNFDEREPATGAFTNLNVGTSLKLIDPKRGPALRLGISARYNRISDSWGGGPALMLAGTYFGLGVGVTRERVSNFLPRIEFRTYQASVRFKIIEVEYSLLTNDSSYDLDPIQILTATLTIQRLVFTGAVRKLNYVLEGDVTQRHFAIQYYFSKRFAAGVMYNYIPGANTLGIQIFL